MFSISATTTTAVVARRSAVTVTRRQTASRVVLARADNNADEAMKATGETAKTEQAVNMTTDKTDSVQSANFEAAQRRAAMNDTSTFDNVMVAFKDSRAVEVINGRAAMIGWMVALGAELNSNTSIGHQVFSEHSITLADGVVRTSTYAGTGFFLIVPVALVALFASLAPSIRNSSPNGLSEEPKAFGPFSPKAEMINGRASMIGLVALPIAEKFINGSALF